MTKLSNCLLFAALLYLRRRRKGKEGYLVFRVSRNCYFFHCMYGERSKSGRLRLWGYVPFDDSWMLLPYPIFSGRGKWGDKP